MTCCDRLRGMSSNMHHLLRSSTSSKFRICRIQIPNLSDIWLMPNSEGLELRLPLPWAPCSKCENNSFAFNTVLLREDMRMTISKLPQSPFAATVKCDIDIFSVTKISISIQFRVCWSLTKKILWNGGRQQPSSKFCKNYWHKIVWLYQQQWYLLKYASHQLEELPQN